MSHNAAVMDYHRRADGSHTSGPQESTAVSLFSPTSLITEDFIIRNIRFFNTVTCCFPGATVSDIQDKLPGLLLSLPSSISRAIVHVDTNDLAREQSELTKKDFNGLFSFINACGKLFLAQSPQWSMEQGVIAHCSVSTAGCNQPAGSTTLVLLTILTCFGGVQPFSGVMEWWTTRCVATCLGLMCSMLYNLYNPPLDSLLTHLHTDPLPLTHLHPPLPTLYAPHLQSPQRHRTTSTPSKPEFHTN